jgi:hypothetical protein
MAIERLKFRCYSCNQLLGATPNKAGSVVTCPKCSAELLIPIPELRADEGPEVQTRSPGPLTGKPRSEVKPKSEPELTAPPQAAAAATAVGSRPTQAPAASYLDELAAMLPPDLIDLKPEDLRVEAEFFESLSRQPQAPPVIREPAPWPPAETLPPDLGSESYVSPSHPRPVVASSNASAPSTGSSFRTETVDLAPKPTDLPPPAQVPASAETALLGTSIEIEHPTILPPGTEVRRVSEITLPASVVLAWSLFVLLAYPLCFVAGLLIGHFLWKTH